MCLERRGSSCDRDRGLKSVQDVQLNGKSFQVPEFELSYDEFITKNSMYYLNCSSSLDEKTIL